MGGDTACVIGDGNTIREGVTINTGTEEAGGRPQWDDYVESGQGMGASLIMAEQMNAYVLADRGTYLGRLNQLEQVQ